MRRSALACLFLVCGCSPLPTELKDIPDMVASVAVEETHVAVTLTRESGVNKGCPYLSSNLKMDVDGQSIPFTSNGSADDAGCHESTVFSIARSQLSTTANDTSTFTLTDGTATFVFGVHQLLLNRTFEWTQPANRVLSPATHVLLGWSGTQDTLDWASSRVEGVAVEGTQEGPLRFATQLRSEDAARAGFSVTPLEGFAAGAGNVDVTIPYRRAITRCEGYSLCESLPTEHRQKFPATFQP